MPNAESNAVKVLLACHDFSRRSSARELERFVVRARAFRFALRLAHEMAEGQGPRSMNALAEDRKRRSHT